MSENQEATPFVAPELDELAGLFPGYEFEGLIACGGMGAVYAAIQRSLDREVAIKILPREFGNDESFRAGFETEAKAMARLNHPNLIGVYDFGDVNGMLYIIMEYVPGQSLFHSAHGTAIDPGETVRLISGICGGLAHAHQHGIIHRDIKPANILLDLHAEPKIGDFGLARPVENKAGEGEEIFGTPHYTAPEVVNNPQNVDHRADIFSVGVMLHELLTGRLPADDPRTPSAIIQCDPRFDVVVRRATDPNPANRYANAAEISEELRKIATSPGPRLLQTAAARPAKVARPAGRSLPAPQPFHPHPSVPVRKSSPLPVILIVLLLAGVGGFIVLHKSKPVDPAPPADTTTTDVPDVAPAPSPVPDKPVAPPVNTHDDDTADSGDTPDQPVVDSTMNDNEEQADPDPGDHEEEEVALKPIFDVDGFLSRAKRIMTSSAEEIAGKRDQALEANLTSFKNDAAREIKEMSFKQARDEANDAVAAAVSDWRRMNGRIPPGVPKDIAGVRNIETVQRNYFDRQALIDEAFSTGMNELGEKYQLGIRLQIDRLDAAEDPDAVTLLQQEIDRAKKSPRYFIGIVLPDEKEIEEEEFIGIVDDVDDEDEEGEEDDE
ncbi:MAG: protein kinase [Verrucomicrobiae bacterium]|nr:protein kinase [Verrucomicrobiae bacterium]